MTDNVTIAEAINNLRIQLEDAQRKGAGQPLQFLAKSVEVELGIVFKNEIEGTGGLKAWFVDVSGKAKAGNETTHKVKLVLEPRGSDGKPTTVSDSEHEKEE